jgi:hypothetical protein
MTTARTPGTCFCAGIAALLALTAVVCRSDAAIAQERPSAQSVRAVMVFNFLKFTEFPPDALADPQHLRLCYSVSDASQADALGALAGRKIGSRELVVVRLGDGSDNCQVLYVDSRQRWNAAMEGRGLGSPLTIGDYRGFVEDRGMIEIDLHSDGNRFDINLAQARSARFRLSPQLLRLARQVHE